MTNNKLTNNNTHKLCKKIQRKKAQLRFIKRCGNAKICCSLHKDDNIELRTCENERDLWSPFHTGKYHNE